METAAPVVRAPPLAIPTQMGSSKGKDETRHELILV